MGEEKIEKNRCFRLSAAGPLLLNDSYEIADEICHTRLLDSKVLLRCEFLIAHSTKSSMINPS